VEEALSRDSTTEIRERVRAAAADGASLSIVGGGSKSFYGRTPRGEPLDLSDHVGLLNYEPKELVLTARAGTALDEIEQILVEHGQGLPFEPPRFRVGASAAVATLGGAIASGLGGPARPHAGAPRDLVLGVRVLTGRGEVLRFGGEVMKNVAGYDISRLMAGAMGTLGILLDISVKVMPRPAVSHTRMLELGVEEALERMTDWAAKPLPISATVWHGGRLWVRLSGARLGVSSAAESIGGEPLDDAVAEILWRDQIRDQAHSFFAGEGPLWRLSLPSAVAPLSLVGDQLIEWSGCQRWLRSDLSADEIRRQVTAVGGHATLFRGGDRSGDVFHPLPETVMRLHRRVKLAFDPLGILNPGRLYAEF